MRKYNPLTYQFEDEEVAPIREVTLVSCLGNRHQQPLEFVSCLGNRHPQPLEGEIPLRMPVAFPHELDHLMPNVIVRDFCGQIVRIGPP